MTETAAVDHWVDMEPTVLRPLTAVLVLGLLLSVLVIWQVASESRPRSHHGAPHLAAG